VFVEESLEDLRLKLRSAEKALEDCERSALASLFTSAIMHEVNNPLEAIVNLVYLTKQQSTDPQVLENMAVIEQQLETLAHVTKQALTFHRKETHVKDWDLLEIVEAALRLHADKIRRHFVKVDRRFRKPTFAKVRGTEILQVISNLLLNAIDAFSKDDRHVQISVRSVGTRAYITVHDNGEGITPELRDHLFEPYRTSKPAGTGLGLWISKRIVEKHGGTIQFRTSHGKVKTGTAFRIGLPLATA
jgi:signal transduction histidine kinase